MTFAPAEFRKLVYSVVESNLGWLPGDLHFKRLQFEHIAKDSKLNWDCVIKRGKGARDVAAFACFSRQHPCEKAIYAFQIIHKDNAILLSHIERFVNCPEELKSNLGAELGLVLTSGVCKITNQIFNVELNFGVKNPLPELHDMYLSYGVGARYDKESDTIFYDGGL